MMNLVESKLNKNDGPSVVKYRLIYVIYFLNRIRCVVSLA